MSLSLDSIKVANSSNSFKPRLLVFGVGGAGGNAVNNMIRLGLDGVEFYVVNTDAQSLEYSLAESKIQIGKEVTGGLGAGALPEIGKIAAEETKDQIKEILSGANMLFITAGMGGGTGTGAAPVIAEIAKSLGVLVIGVVTKPFDFEGKSRQKIADGGILELKKHVDTLIVIPNQNLFRVVNERTSFVDAFKIADEVLYSGVKCITDLITMPGLVNLDFADVKTVMKNMGRAMMSSGEATGEDRAVKASELAIINPLLDISSVNGAKGVLINITGGSDMTLFEVNDAVETIRSNLEESANIIFGAIFNEKHDGFIRVSVVATGVGEIKDESENIQQQNIVISESKHKNINYEENKFTKNTSNEIEQDYIEKEVNSNEVEKMINIKHDATQKQNIQENFTNFDEDNSFMIENDYMIGEIKDASRETLLKKIHTEYNVNNSAKKSTELSHQNHLAELRAKRGIGGVINNILFGSGDEVKKKVNKRNEVVAVDLFENDLLLKQNIEYFTSQRVS